MTTLEQRRIELKAWFDRNNQNYFRVFLSGNLISISPWIGGKSWEKILDPKRIDFSRVTDIEIDDWRVFLRYSNEELENGSLEYIVANLLQDKWGNKATRNRMIYLNPDCYYLAYKDERKYVVWKEYNPFVLWQEKDVDWQDAYVNFINFLKGSPKLFSFIEDDEDKDDWTICTTILSEDDPRWSKVFKAFNIIQELEIPRPGTDF